MIQKAREPTVLENYKKGMEQMYRMTLGKTRQTWMEPINTKFIVANYLVQKFPDKVFDSKDEPEEVDLNRAGNILFLFFEDAYITTKAGRELSDEQCNGLIDCTIEYIDRFKVMLVYLLLLFVFDCCMYFLLLFVYTDYTHRHGRPRTPQRSLDASPQPWRLLWCASGSLPSTPTIAASTDSTSTTGRTMWREGTVLWRRSTPMLESCCRSSAGLETTRRPPR